jgi:hypothetical protein
MKVKTTLKREKAILLFKCYKYKRETQREFWYIIFKIRAKTKVLSEVILDKNNCIPGKTVQKNVSQSLR